MQLTIHQIDAFTSELFKGNYAAVIDVEAWLSDELMLKIGAENNVSETAFTCKQADGSFAIRWFSPLMEIDFCGHATLAAAFVLCEQHDVKQVTFHAPAVGELIINKNDDASFTMTFPKQAPSEAENIPSELFDGLSIQPIKVLKNQQAYFVIYENEDDVVHLKTDSSLLKTLYPLDVVATAKSTEYDFISRYFWPASGGDEDFVTGSIHTGLAPYWAQQLGKKSLSAYQASSRGGHMQCDVGDHTVTLTGRAVRYMQGTIYL
ncbi:PhzF family phenazine biosynthesis protein [Pseudoalteromonas sp. NEC-BIFX-2020_015]|uniref:PhzF family phenazine biosynthesis protein n=1 Tax=Pseudoalteromonas sp. NEC-BIFX-2020_015 TaxID=2729544 RepID=UPI0014613B72|nr:PhzF family phenazine biosynthesis protein [Pseudoalteromonas sp. NEC-BIFX-2020_015]NMR24671.1 PhzF family phenazine biosynthesis protein [Pseudoalteromonas sp. NEC-BIFX-2020_015]